MVTFLKSRADLHSPWYLGRPYLAVEASRETRSASCSAAKHSVALAIRRQRSTSLSQRQRSKENQHRGVPLRVLLDLVVATTGWMDGPPVQETDVRCYCAETGNDVYPFPSVSPGRRERIYCSLLRRHRCRCFLFAFSQKEEVLEVPTLVLLLSLSLCGRSHLF